MKTVFQSARLSKIAAISLLSLGAFASVAYAYHAWGGYHWARIANPFTLKLDDNVSSVWDGHLAGASGDWNAPSAYPTVLFTTVVPGQSDPKNCRPKSGRVEVCNSKYGNNGWLGIASIWASGNHITQGTVKFNDTYFNTAQYNTPAWKQFVTCQEIGHTFGLDHQDEIFGNPNLGTCMDYTNDPNGTVYGQLSNEKPNAHDYEELAAIYQHLDDFTTLLFDKKSSAAASDIDTSNPSEWGREVRRSADGRGALYERNLGRGEKVFTFVIWADQDAAE